MPFDLVGDGMRDPGTDAALGVADGTDIRNEASSALEPRVCIGSDFFILCLKGCEETAAQCKCRPMILTAQQNNTNRK